MSQQPSVREFAKSFAASHNWILVYEDMVCAWYRYDETSLVGVSTDTLELVSTNARVVVHHPYEVMNFIREYGEHLAEALLESGEINFHIILVSELPL